MDETDDINQRREGLSSTKQALLEQRLRGLTSAAKRAAILPKPAGVQARLSFAQERMFFAAQLNPDSSAYNMHAAYRLTGTLDLAALTASLNAVIARHAVLRTHFKASSGYAEPCVVEQLAVEIPVVDVSALPPAEQEQRLGEVGRAEARHVFDLAQLPLLRVSLARLNSEQHVLFLVMHHIICDEWSMRLLWQELEAGYTARIQGRSPNLTPIPLQYEDFAYWQRERLSAGGWDSQLAYWRQHLSGALPRLQFPLDFPRPAVQRYEGAVTALTLEDGTWRALERLNQQSGTTPFMLLLALYAVLLSRYSGQEDVLIGAPVANRGQPELQELIGVCLNTLVLRVDLSGDPSFGELLQRVRASALNAFANSDLPFEKLVDELKPARDLSYHPLFQAMFVYQSQPSHPSLPGVQVEPYPVDGGVSKFDLTLFAGEGQEIFLEYNTDLIVDSTARRFLSNFAVLATAAASAPDTPISRLPVLSAEERRQVLVDWNDTAVESSHEMLIHQLFEASARRTPDTPALLHGGQTMSYAELDRQAAHLAARLREAGVSRGTVVGLCAERSFELLVGMLAILKAGGAYLPLDPKYPAERRAFMLSDSGAQVVVAQPNQAALLAAEGVRVVTVSPGAAGLVNLPEVVEPDDLAYIIYTSGSTGKPKGVPVTHRQLVHSTLARASYYPEPVGRFLLLSSFAFDSSVAGIFGTLCTGGTLCLPEQGQEQDVNAVAGLIERWKITHTLMLPSLYSLLLEYSDPDELRSLRAVMVAGEACPLSLVRQHFAALPGAQLYNEYGPTEGTVWCSVYRMTAEFKGLSVPIGRPIQNTRLYILDQHLQPSPIGVPGELYLAGDGVVDGYWNRPELTAERFVQHLWAETGAQRLYRTGDLARWLPDGNIEFLGRVDHQVKIRGHRIELGEIETALLEQPGVGQAAVLALSERPPATDPNDLEGLAAAVEAGGEEALRLLEALERSSALAGGEPR